MTLLEKLDKMIQIETAKRCVLNPGGDDEIVYMEVYLELRELLKETKAA